MFRTEGRETKGEFRHFVSIKAFRLNKSIQCIFSNRWHVTDKEAMQCLGSPVNYRLPAFCTWPPKYSSAQLPRKNRPIRRPATTQSHRMRKTVLPVLR